MRAPARNRNVTACALAAIAPALLGLLAAGCASPGAPLPPSLKLPEPVTDLTAIRAGSQVMLHWTTSARTTDRLLVSGAVTAEICREAASPAAARPSRAARAGTVPCTAVVHVPVSPGPTDAADALPAPLTSGAPTALAYRVWLVNSAGRTAGPSVVAYAASGEAPPPVTGLRASSTKPGVVLEWEHAPQAGAPQSGETVELERTLQPDTSRPAANASRSASAKSPIALGDSATAESHFRARDTGGAIDRTAQAGATYRYSVQRVREVQLAGRTLELRGDASQTVEVATRGVFPPDTPAGLVAAPAYSQTGSQPGKPAIDLSWEPAVELRIAGYKVYRRQGSAPWQLLTPQPVRVAAYTDASVALGERYAYRVTAVNDAGLESPPSAEAAETASAR